MPRFETAIEISAAPERVWQALIDVQSLPNWTASMTDVRLDPPGPLAVGSRARIRQPKLGSNDWTVTELAPLTSFTWVNRRTGLLSTASHVIEPTPAGGARLRLALEQSGFFAPILGALTGGLTRRYISMEAAGIKTAAESTSDRQPAQ
jgi:uncharacterized protein YndB with AHSA1/START domain